MKNIHLLAGEKLIDSGDEKILSDLSSAPIYRKYVQVKARAAREGERTRTVLSDGYLETGDRAIGGDWVVTNPSGEEYIVSAEDFTLRYQKTAKEGIFQAVGRVRALRNPFRQAIALEASWGEVQHGDSHCFLAITIDDSDQLASDFYLIDGDVFRSTYKKV